MGDEAVVLIHGLFMSGREMAFLRRQLAVAGFSTRQFSYPSVRVSPAAAARLLGDFVADIEAPVVHYVAHSLGGLVLRHFLHGHADRQPGSYPGRVVTLATPHQGSRAARALANNRLGRRLLGQSVEQGLLGDVPAWPDDRALGVIAGSRGMGLGRFLARLDLPHDGTVAAAETELSAATDRILLPVSHFGSLFSREVADQAIYFLREGRFWRGATLMNVDDIAIEQIAVEDLRADKSGALIEQMGSLA
ncbi:MAG: alpha/beta hydrolase [Pseudomonadota bacterium]|nr:alpha/beta hydrolase [Pseudomonadota bacterium]